MKRFIFIRTGLIVAVLSLIIVGFSNPMTKSNQATAVNDAGAYIKVHVMGCNDGDIINVRWCLDGGLAHLVPFTVFGIPDVPAGWHTLCAECPGGGGTVTFYTNGYSLQDVYVYVVPGQACICTNE